MYDDFNDIDIIEFGPDNPAFSSPNSPYICPFKQTRDTLLDADVYRDFIHNAVTQFRKSRVYKNYKGFLIGLGMDHCQMLGNINNEMATIEMHHVISIDDVALIICEHVLNVLGYITTFDLIHLLRKEHTEHHMQLTMLALTSHQLYHEDMGMYIAPSMTFGDWFTFLSSYRYGITQDIAFKVLMYVNRAIDEKDSNDNSLLDLRNCIADWSVYNNEQFYH